MTVANKHAIENNKDITRLICNFACIIFITFLHPLLSLTLCGLLNIFSKINKFCIFYLGLAYSLLLVNREYLINFAEGIGDDSFRYIPFIKGMIDYTLHDALISDINIFSIEPLPRLYWWLSISFGVNINFVLLIQTLFWVSCFAYFSIKLNERYALAILGMGIMFFSYTIPYTFFHLYRQAWGLAFFVLYLSLWDKKIRFLFLFMAGAGHIMFIPLLMLMEFSRKGSKIVLSKYFLPLITFFLIALYLIYPVMMSKTETYSEGLNVNYAPVKYIVYFFCFSFLLACYNYYNKGTVRLSNVKFNLYITLMFFYIIGLYPALSDISNRYILLLAPLTLMALTITKNKAFLLILFSFSILKLLIHLNDLEGNIYQYTMKGYLDFYNIFDVLYFYIERNI